MSSSEPTDEALTQDKERTGTKVLVVGAVVLVTGVIFWANTASPGAKKRQCETEVTRQNELCLSRNSSDVQAIASNCYPAMTEGMAQCQLSEKERATRRVEAEEPIRRAEEQARKEAVEEQARWDAIYKEVQAKQRLEAESKLGR